MKYVNFKYIKVKNILSIGDNELRIDFKRGINIITGNNKDKPNRSNGIGKSTIADSIHFGIFGETIRSIPKSNISNNITKNGASVEIVFSVNTNNKNVEYKIIRNLLPSKCSLYMDGADITESSIANTNEKIKEILSTSPEIFQNCIIMSLNNTLPFMAQTKVNKRKFIEGIFNLEVFSKMLLSVRAEHTSLTKDYAIKSNNLLHQKNCVSIISEQIESRKKEEEEKEKRYIENINNKKRKMEDIKSKIKPLNKSKIETAKHNIDSLKSKIKNIENEMDELKDKKYKIYGRKSSLEDKKSKIRSDLSKCPVCLSEITNIHKNYIEDEKSKISNDIHNLQDEANCLHSNINELSNHKNIQNNKLEQYNQYIRDIIILVENNKMLKSRISDIKSEIENIENEIKEFKKYDNSKFNNQIKEYRDKILTLSKEIDDLLYQSKIYEKVKYVLSEEGVKSYIVKRILNILNKTLLFYLKKLDANCICVFNEFFEEEIINDRSRKCSYFNFSGAERKAIDLACLFTFMDLRRIQGNVYYNLLMFDELLDSSLDEKGIELVINILKDRVKKYKESVYIISHRKESIKECSGEVIFLEKDNSITRRIEFNR